MKQEHIKYFACPDCSGELAIIKVERGQKGSIEDGQLQCCDCKVTYDVVRHVPRFVPVKNYAAGFGFEWNRHARTQYDSYTGTNISEKRFFQETKWSRNLRGQTILEVGSGSGRFTEQAASTGAMVVSLDYSSAVDANYGSNGHKDNVLVVQGDIYSMPFKTHFFDKLFCMGVLQHTPDPEGAFLCLPKYLKPGGSLAIDIYYYRWWRYLVVTRYWVRPITKRLPPETLYRWCERYVNLMWPLSRWVDKLPKGRYINRALLIADYRGVYPLSEELLKEWAVLDTFDGLSPAYDKPKSLKEVKEWFTKAGLENVEVYRGFSGIEGRGTKTAQRTV